MDRCRCDDYRHAVEKLRFYTVGTVRPDIIENYDRWWITAHSTPSIWIASVLKHSLYEADVMDLRRRKVKGSTFIVQWVKKGISSDDRKFMKPKAYKKLKPEELPENQIPKEIRKIEQMWCPFMTPIRRG